MDTDNGTYNTMFVDPDELIAIQYTLEPEEDSI